MNLMHVPYLETAGVLNVDVDGAFSFFQETKWNMVAMALLYYSAWILKALLGDDALKLQW